MLRFQCQLSSSSNPVPVTILLALMTFSLIGVGGVAEKLPLQTSMSLPEHSTNLRSRNSTSFDSLNLEPQESRGLKIGNLVDIRWKNPPLPPIRGLSLGNRIPRRRPKLPSLPISTSLNIFTGLLSNAISSISELLEVLVGSIGLFLYVIYSIITIPFQIFTNSAWDRRALLS